MLGGRCSITATRACVRACDGWKETTPTERDVGGEGAVLEAVILVVFVAAAGMRVDGRGSFVRGWVGGWVGRWVWEPCFFVFWWVVVWAPTYLPTYSSSETVVVMIYLGCFLFFYSCP